MSRLKRCPFCGQELSLFNVGDEFAGCERCDYYVAGPEVYDDSDEVDEEDNE